MKQNLYAIVKYDGAILSGKLDPSGTKLKNIKKKYLYLTLSDDTIIIKKFNTKKDMENFKSHTMAIRRNQVLRLAKIYNSRKICTENYAWHNRVANMQTNIIKEKYYINQ